MKKAIKYIDIHGHINFPDYDADREEVIARAAEAGVGMIVVGTDIESSKKAIELAETHENIWATVGVHPTEIVESQENKEQRVESKYEEKIEIDNRNREEALARNDSSAATQDEKRLLQGDTLGFPKGATLSKSRALALVGGAGQESDPEHDIFEDLLNLALNPKVVAIGECGLDYFHSKESDIPAQIEAFEKHIKIANEVKKPLMLHVRSGKKIEFPGNAYEDALNILKKSAKVPFNFHFFAGSVEDMKVIFDQGGTVSFTGVLTFTNDYDELVKSAPLERIMSETDCPYVAPVPYRGKRSEPIHVIEVAKAIARIRGEDEEDVRAALLDNAYRFFCRGPRLFNFSL